MTLYSLTGRASSPFHAEPAHLPGHRSDQLFRQSLQRLFDLTPDNSARLRLIPARGQGSRGSVRDREELISQPREAAKAVNLPPE
jgi:hypothetical protein